MITITVRSNSYFKDAEAASAVSTWVNFEKKSLASLPMCSQSAPPSHSCFRWCVFFVGLHELAEDVPVQALSVAIDAALMLYMGAHSLVDTSRGCISLAAEVETVSWQERLVESGAHGHLSLLVEDGWHRITEDPDMSKGQTDRDVQEK